MIKKKNIKLITGIWAAASSVAALVLKRAAKKTTYTAELMEPIEQRRMGFYEKYIKRFLDIACSSIVITVFSPLYIGIAITVRIRLGSPVLFTQDRPGLIGLDGKEQIFKMYKFRSMTDEKDENGNLLPDDIRLTSFGKKLRATSLDELPEAFNIMNGSMSVIGPRPQLIKDMVFMSNEQRMRHSAKPGLSGLAQVKGRNAITWEEKLNWDIKYIERISFLEDLKLVWNTIKKVFLRRNITKSSKETDVTLDYGDALLKEGFVTKEEYKNLQRKAENIKSNHYLKRGAYE